MTFIVDHYQHLSIAQQTCIKELIQCAYHNDGVEPVSEQTIFALSSDQAHHLLAYNNSNQLIGYLSYSRLPAHSHWVGECVVDPRHRRRGIATTLIHQAGIQTKNNIHLWAHATLPTAQKLAQKLGLVSVRTLLQMERSLENLPHQIVCPTIPETISIRCYRNEYDDDEILRVNNAAFQWHPEQGHWTKADLISRYQSQWFIPEGLFLAYDHHDHLQGFHWTKISPDQLGLGEVYIVGIDPLAQGQGLGTALTAIGLSYLADKLSYHPKPRVILYVESDNIPALRTYSKLGFYLSRTDTVYAMS